MTATIQTTGLRGFLQWLQQDQPAIYAATAAQIQKAVPRGFSGFNGAVTQKIRLSQGRRSMRLRGYAGFGCCAPLQSVGLCAAMAPAPSFNFCSPNVSCAANMGPTCNSTLTGVANIISSVAGAALSQEQLNSYNNMVQQQLQRASSGTWPLGVTSASLGIQKIGGASGSTWLLLGGGLLLAVMLARR
jgi:hypothetical protein